MEYITELFVLKCATIKADLSRVTDEQQIKKIKSDMEVATDAMIAPHLGQIDYQIRASAERMAEFYQIFYMLENDIRKFVQDVLYETYEDQWWTKYVPEAVKSYAKSNKDRESKE